jgi:hypothetical protein
MQSRVASSPPSPVRSQLMGDDYLAPEASLLTRLHTAYKALRALEKVQDDPVAGGLLTAALDDDVFRRHAARPAFLHSQV